MKSIVAVVLSAFAVTLSFPTVVAGVHFPDLSGLIWVALVPLFLVIRHASAGRAAKLVFWCGFWFNAGVSYWIVYAMYHYGELNPFLCLLALFMMAAIFGGLMAGCVWLAYRFTAKFGLPWVLSVPIFLTVFELLHNYIPFGGYPWSNLAYALWSHRTLAQASDLFGVYGFDFLLLLVNAVLVELIVTRGRIKRSWWTAGGALVLVLFFYGYGRWRLPQINRITDEAPSFKVGLVQPNIPQELKWDPRYANEHMEILGTLTERALEEGAELVIWPESAFSDPLPATIEQLNELSSWERPLLMGAVTIKLEVPGRYTPQRKIYNSALQVDPGGQVVTLHHKTHLVPMGEYIPLKSIFRFLDEIVPALGDFVAGDEWVVFTELDHPTGVTICYEDLFPEVNRAFTRRGATYLTNITNDAWYGDSSAPWQHLVFSRFRAIENRRSVVRVTNNAVTALIDPTGKVRETLPLNVEAHLVSDVPLLTLQSFYTAYGDWPLFSLLGLILLYNVGGYYVRTRRTT